MLSDQAEVDSAQSGILPGRIGRRCRDVDDGLTEAFTFPRTRNINSLSLLLPPLPLFDLPSTLPPQFLFYRIHTPVAIPGSATMISARSFIAPARQCLRTTRVSPSLASPVSQVFPGLIVRLTRMAN